MKPQIVSRNSSDQDHDAETERPVIQGRHARHEVRMSLLIEAAKFAPKAVSVEIFCRQVRKDGLSVAVREIERELQYLLDKEMMVDVPQRISPEIHRYRIHANGTDYLAEQGFEDE